MHMGPRLYEQRARFLALVCVAALHRARRFFFVFGCRPQLHDYENINISDSNDVCSKVVLRSARCTSARLRADGEREKRVPFRFRLR